MQSQFVRTEMLFGKEAMAALKDAHVAVFGIGGVGSYVVEVLARSGIGELSLVDSDEVSLSNINRQLVATLSTVGQKKVDVACRHIKDINFECRTHVYPIFYLPETAEQIDLSACDYVVDCIDTISAKIELIRRCHEFNIPIISCMGAANKIDPTQFKVSDIYKTKVDPLAKVLRKKLKTLGINHLKVVYSEEFPLKPSPIESELEETTTSTVSADSIITHSKRVTPASNAFVPASAGLILGGEVVKDIIHRNDRNLSA